MRSHHLGALVVLISVGWLAVRLYANNASMALLMGGVLAVQLCLGILNVVWTLPLAIATLHNGIGALLLLALVTVNFAPTKN